MTCFAFGFFSTKSFLPSCVPQFVLGMLLAGTAGLATTICGAAETTDTGAARTHRDALAEVVRQAVKNIAPYLVRIDTIGGYDKVDDVPSGDGAGTGLLLDRNGHVMTSAYNFLHEPSSIIVRLHDGRRKVARKIATDLNRMLTLLKIENVDFPATEFPDETRFAILGKDDLRIGQWAIAVGRALSAEEPNVSLGIVSGKHRIWGKAIQCDAKISPNNYGGPLIDVRGRVMGLLVPLSMTENGIAAGADMYDGGVGFAIPFEDVNRVFERLKAGRDLKPGVLGFTFDETTMFTSEAKVLDVVKHSPAELAGMKRGDVIVNIDGEKIDSALQANTHLHRRYAGDEMIVSVLRKIDPKRDDKAENFTEHVCRCRLATHEEFAEMTRPDVDARTD